jgi:hypothetical protein
MMEWTGVILAEPGVLEGMRVVNLVHLGEEEPKVVKGFSRDKLTLGKSVQIGGGASEIGHQGVV